MADVTASLLSGGIHPPNWLPSSMRLTTVSNSWSDCGSSRILERFWFISPLTSSFNTGPTARAASYASCFGSTIMENFLFIYPFRKRNFANLYLHWKGGILATNNWIIVKFENKLKLVLEKLQWKTVTFRSPFLQNNLL